jgi:NADPH:quinone reductase-like Zn-dependent oxidoreductase
MNKAATKTVLVTGGAGYIGSHTCKILAQEGYQPIAFDNLSSGHTWAAKWGPLEKWDILYREVTPECLSALCGVRLRWRVGFKSNGRRPSAHSDFATLGTRETVTSRAPQGSGCSRITTASNALVRRKKDHLCYVGRHTC